MAVTAMSVDRPNRFAPVIPNVTSAAIHDCEAILATLAMIVWHFYHVIFDPDVYPMNFAWFDGKMSEHQFEEEHPRAYEESRQESGDDDGKVS